MTKDFENRIKKIEQELTNLKTSSEYSSVRSVHTASTTGVYTGLYRIDYSNPKNEPVMSLFYKNDSNFGIPYGRTPSTTSQIVEVNSTRWSNTQQQYITETTSMVVVSNVAVTGITRIS